jgi:Xaa-Pro dipeptidase
MALEEGGRVDFTRLRQDRRRALFDAMDAAALEVLVLGRPANVRYASGARQLWRTGANPFAPLCVVVRATGKVHLLSSWDEGVPPEIGREDLYGLFWDPGHLIAALREIPGLVPAHRVGTDSLTPFFGRVLRDLVPGIELVDASPDLERVRAHKTADEIGAIEVAVSLAEAGLAALEAALRPGMTERALLGAYMEAVSSLGAPTPPSESVVFATPRQGPVRFRYLTGDRTIAQGELVVLAPGALYAGYEGGVARTRTAGAPSLEAQALADRCHRALDTLLGACRAGKRGADLYRAWESTGEPPTEVALATGVGLGTETPLVGFGRGADAVFEEGAVLSVQAWVAEEGTGGFLLRELVRIGEDSPEILTRGDRSAGSAGSAGSGGSGGSAGSERSERWAR